MNTTSSSTAIDDQWRERRLGPELWNRTRALLDRLDELEGKQPDPTCARKSRTDRLEALIGAAVNNIRASLKAVNYRFRTTMVLDHLKMKHNTLYNYKKLPSREKVKQVLIAKGLYK